MTSSENKSNLTFTANYLVSNIECSSCEESCENAIKNIPGRSIKAYNMKKTDSNENLLTIESNIPPSRLVTALQDIGKDAVIRGTSSSLQVENDLGACTAILEAPEDTSNCSDHFEENEITKSIINQSTVLGVRVASIRGIVRAIELNSGSKSKDSEIWLDLALTKLPNLNSNYNLNIHKFGNVQNFNTLGPIMKSIQITLNNGSDFKAINSSLKNVAESEASASLKLKDLVGRGVSICNSNNSECFAIGLWARSSGMWSNTKKVCACSGKTVWEERKDALESGLV
ncbi:hypothetical protein QEN19_002763 [Hanseniaspora menglaensis]